MPAPYIGHLSPEIQELSERLLRLQVSQAERAFEQEGVERPAVGRAPGPEPAMAKAGAEAYSAALEREKVERAARAAEMTASINERQQDLAERKQDWEMVKFGMEQRATQYTAQMKAMAPMKVGERESVYIPGTGQFATPGLDIPEMYTEEGMAEVIFYDKRTGEQTGSIAKELVKNVEVVQDEFHNNYLFDLNTGDFLGRKLSGLGGLEYNLAMEKATSPVGVALINERASKGVARIQALSAADVAGITGKTDIDVAMIEAAARMAKILSDEKIAMWGIDSTEKIEEARNLIEKGRLILVEGRLMLDREALASLDLNKIEQRNLTKYLEIYKADILRDLGIQNIEVRKEELAVTLKLGLLEAETEAKAQASAEQAAKWTHEGREETRKTLQFRAESDRTFQEGQNAIGVTKNNLYEKSIDNDRDVGMLRARAYDRITGAETRATLSGIERDDKLAKSKVFLEQKEMWYKNEIIRIRDLETKLETLRVEWTQATGDAKLRLQGLVTQAETNLMGAQAKALEVRSKLDTEQAEYDRQRNIVLDADVVRKNNAWAKMLRDGIDSLSKEEKLVIGTPLTTPYVATTMEEVLHLYDEKQKILAEWGPYGEGTWEQRKQVMEYEMAIDVTKGRLTEDQKLEYYKKTSEIDTKTYKAKAGIDLQAKKDFFEYKSREDKYYIVKDPKTGNTVFVDKATMQAEASFNPAGEEVPTPKYHYFADDKAGVMRTFESGVEILTTPIGKALGRKQKENLFERLWKSAIGQVKPEFGMVTPEGKTYAARIFIGMVEMDPSLTPAEKAQYKSWASIIAGEDVKLSEMLTGEAMPMVELPGEGITFEEFADIFNRATQEGGAPAAPVAPTPTPTKKPKKATNEQKMKWMQDYWKAHPNATKDDVVNAARKHFGE